MTLMQQKQLYQFMHRQPAQVTSGSKVIVTNGKYMHSWLSSHTNSFQARNFMRDQMKIGQLAFFYHSNCKDPGIAGIVEVMTLWQVMNRLVRYEGIIIVSLLPYLSISSHTAWIGYSYFLNYLHDHFSVLCFCSSRLWRRAMWIIHNLIPKILTMISKF